MALIVTNKNAEQNTRTTSPDPEVLEDAPDSESACDKNCIRFTHCNEACAAGAEWAVMIDTQKHCFHTKGHNVWPFLVELGTKVPFSNTQHKIIRINLGRNSPRPFILKSKFVQTF